MVFHLRFDPSEVPFWAERYVAGSTPVEIQQEADIEQRVVPAARARGYLTKPEFPVFDVDSHRVLPETLDVYFRDPAVWPLLAGRSTGTNVRRRRLHPDAFLSFQMRLPPMQAQERLRDVKACVDAVKRLHVKATPELDALLPAVLDRAFKGEL